MLCAVVFLLIKVFSTSMGLTKTVYNPDALRAAQKNSEEVLKKKQVREKWRETGRGRDSKVTSQ